MWLCLKQVTMTELQIKFGLWKIWDRYEDWRQWHSSMTAMLQIVVIHALKQTWLLAIIQEKWHCHPLVSTMNSQQMAVDQIESSLEVKKTKFCNRLLILSWEWKWMVAMDYLQIQTHCMGKKRSATTLFKTIIKWKKGKCFWNNLRVNDDGNYSLGWTIPSKIYFKEAENSLA